MEDQVFYMKMNQSEKFRGTLSQCAEHVPIFGNPNISITLSFSAFFRFFRSFFFRIFCASKFSSSTQIKLKSFGGPFRGVQSMHSYEYEMIL